MKHRMGIWILGLVFAAAIIACQSKKDGGLKLVAANAQHWSGGIAGRSGTHYTITLHKEGKGKLTFDSVWIKNEGAFAILPNYSPDDNTAYLAKKNDTTGTCVIQLNAFHVMGNNYPTDMPRPVERNTNNPFNATGEAVVSYRYNGKKYLLPVTLFKQAAPINYP